MKKKRHVLRQAARAMALPEDIVLGMPRVLLRGDSSLLLENHHGVIEYTQERLRIRTMLGIVVVEGVDLCLTELGERDLMLSGTIEGIALSKGASHGKGRVV